MPQAVLVREIYQLLPEPSAVDEAPTLRVVA